MAEAIFDCTTSGSNLQKYGKIKVDYSAGNGSITINSLSGNRTDGYGGGANHGNNYFTLTVGGQSRNISCSNIQFGGGTYVGWSSFDAQTFSGLSGNTSVSIDIHSNGSLYNYTWAGTIDAGTPHVYPSISSASVTGTVGGASYSVSGSNINSCSWNIGGKGSSSSSGSISGLAHNTSYNWSVSVSSVTGDSDSRSGTFTTLGNAPSISGCNATPTYNSCVLSPLYVLDTNASFSSREIQYGETTNYGSTTTLNSITGLSPDTQYYYRVRVTDNYNRTSSWYTGSFTTDTPPLPSITAPELISATDNSLTVSAIATPGDLASISKIEFSINDLDWFGESSPYTFTGLLDGTTYNVRAAVTDNYGRTVWGDTSSMTTLQGKFMKVITPSETKKVNVYIINSNGKTKISKNQIKII